MLSNLTTNENTPATADSARDAKGQFKPGNKGGPGNPFAGQVAFFRKAVLEHVSQDDIRDIIKGLVEMAKNGHWQAAKLILQYTLGKPQALPDPDEMPTDWDAPSTNGELQVAPSTNGDLEDAPSTNGELENAPSTNGELEEAPSTNGDFEPVLNRKQRRALRKTRRLAKNQRNSPPPVPQPGSATLAS